MRLRLLLVGIAITSTGCLVGDPDGDEDAVGKQPRGTANAFGSGDTFFANGSLDPAHEFFSSLGVNGRTCGSCHVQGEGWSISPEGVRRRFDQTGGMDAIFRTNDGSNSPNADVSSYQARRAAYSMLLDKALVRVGLPIPAGADFELVAVDDPYGFASASELSLFRRPLPTTNLFFLPTIMWDGRETIDPADLHGNLLQQSRSATLGHALATNTDPVQMAAIVDAELGLFSAQIADRKAGDLDSDGATGGPLHLADVEFYIGINDPLGGNPRGIPFNPNAFTLFDAWQQPANPPNNSIQNRTRWSIYRGQQIFNTRPINITGVKGLNDVLGVPSITGTCTVCHDTPNIGNHSVPLPIDIGISDASRRTPDMPLYTFRHIATGQTIQSTDPGLALISGRFADINKFKGPILRGLAMRPPYFHNGLAADLGEVVDFYEERFGLGLSAQEREDLIAFLAAL